MTDRETRQRVIEILQKEKKTALHDNKWAFDYAINSIETDLKYDLLYEETSGQADKPTTKNDLAVDAVSRQAINGYIDYILSHGMGKRKSFEFIKKFVANLPSVTPQEPILDQITEIIEPLRHLPIGEMSDIEWDILRVIDKYKAETER